MLKRIRDWRPRLSYANVAATVALILATTGVAAATLPTSSGIIYACYQKNNGVLHKVSSRQRCSNNEKRLSWNIQGIQGLRGLAGPVGPVGPKGTTGSRGYTGAKGATGIPGSPGGAKGWGKIAATGTLSVNSSSVTSVTHPTNGSYCVYVTGASPATDVIVVSPNGNNDDTSSSVQAFAEAAANNSDCGSTGFEIYTYAQTVTAGTLQNTPAAEGFTFVVG